MKTESTQTQQPQQEKKLMGKVEWIFLCSALLILGYILLQNNGIHIVEQSEDVQILNNPHPEHKIYNIK